MGIIGYIPTQSCVAYPEQSFMESGIKEKEKCHIFVQGDKLLRNEWGCICRCLVKKPVFTVVPTNMD